MAVSTIGGQGYAYVTSPVQNGGNAGAVFVCPVSSTDGTVSSCAATATAPYLYVPNSWDIYCPISTSNGSLDADSCIYYNDGGDMVPAWVLY